MGFLGGTITVGVDKERLGVIIGNKGRVKKQLEEALEVLLGYMHKLYNEAELVHADLSEYNVMNREGELIIIDWGSAVKKGHPMFTEFLLRDIRNVLRFFHKLGVKVPSVREVFEWITH